MATPVDFSQEPEELECDSRNLPDDVGAFADVWAELLAVTSPESADAFVETACADLGPDKLAARYGGISALRLELAPFVMVAGGGRPRLDPRVEDLLCYADSVKDFDKLGVLPDDRKRPAPEIEGLRSYLPDDFESLPRTNSAPCRAKVPYADIKAALNPVLPAGCDDVTCRHKGAFSDFLKTSPELRFGEPIDNPFKGVDLHAGFCVIKDGRIRVRCDGTGNYIGDIPEQDLAALKAACTGQRESGDSALMSVDSLNEVYADEKKHALIALEIADVCCQMRVRFGTTATFVVDNTFDEILTRFMLATREVDAAFMRRFKIGTDFERTVTETVGEVHWTVVLCDASMLDKRKITGAVTLEDETGDVYHADAAAQVTLKGVEFEKGKLRRPLNLLYAVDGVDSKIRVATEEFSISTTAIKVARGEDTIARLLALKRAADYGQVQHCATHNCVFVSTDELPCMYAHARGVPMLFLKSTSFKKSDGSDFLLQTTFVMNRPGDFVQSGGGAPYVSMMASAVACAVIAFCLYMGS